MKQGLSRTRRLREALQALEVPVSKVLWGSNEESIAKQKKMDVGGKSKKK